MKLGRSVTVAALVASLFGCVGNNASLSVLGLSPIDEDCNTTASAIDGPTGVLVDLNVAGRAAAAPVVRNNMVQTQSTLPPEAEVHTVLIEGANVKFRTGNVGRLAERYVPTIGSVAPGQGSSSVPFELLSGRDIDILRGDRALAVPGSTANILANVKIEGRMTDGGRITSSEVAIPIKICKGCLQRPLPPDACCEPLVPCGGIRTKEETPTKQCTLGQDTLVDFCSYERARR